LWHGVFARGCKVFASSGHSLGMHLRKPRTQESDEERFEQLYHDHVRAIAAYLRARTDQESAVDALARTFEIAWRRLPDIPENPRAWLFGVARRVLADQRRSAGRHETLVARISETIASNSQDHAGVIDAREAILAALMELPEQQREALLLVAWDGLSQREAATVLDCSTSALAVRVHRARKRLRAAIGDAELPELPASDEPVPAINHSSKEAL
jgi:RNA polymerase sigma-70 factor, ECF subfamily